MDLRDSGVRESSLISKLQARERLPPKSNVGGAWKKHQG